MKKKLTMLLFSFCCLFVLSLPIYAKDSAKTLPEEPATTDQCTCGNTKKLVSWHVKLAKELDYDRTQICPVCEKYTIGSNVYTVYDGVYLNGNSYDNTCFVPVNGPCYFVAENVKCDEDSTFYATLVDENGNQDDIFQTSFENDGYSYYMYEEIPSSYLTSKNVGKRIKLFCYTWANGTNLDADRMAGTNFIVIDSPIKIKESPVSTKVNKGSNVTFACKASGSNLKYQWYYNDYDSTYDGVAISGATSSSLTLKNVPSSYNNRYYYCKVSNYSATTSFSKVTKTTGTAKLTVSSAYKYTKKGTITSLKSNKKGYATVKFKKVSGAAGVQISFDIRKSFAGENIFKKSTSTSVYKKATFTIKGLKSKKYAYCRVRPYVKKSGKTYYGKWSSVKKVKVK